MSQTQSCPCCGGSLQGDGSRIPLHCEYAQVPRDAEGDSGPWFCMQQIPIWAEQTIKDLRQQVASLEAQRNALDQACRAMLAGDLEAYKMMRAALAEVA
jgi:hypothetical protein